MRLTLRPSAVLLTLALACSAAAVDAFAGNEGPHGGDYVAQQFTLRGRNILDALATVYANRQILTPAQLVLLANSVSITPVHSTPDQLLDAAHNVVDAATFDDPTSPDGKTIMLQRDRWLTLLQDGLDTDRLVLHEYLWTIGADDTNYVISDRLVLTPPAPPVPACGFPSVVVTGCNDTLVFHYTSGQGASGTLRYTGETARRDVWLNPACAATVLLTGSNVQFYYDNRLKGHINVTSDGSNVVYYDTVTN